MQQIVVRQFAASLLRQQLKRRSVLGKAPLQSARTHPQLPRDILYPRPLPGDQPFENAFHLFSKTFRSHLLRQFRLELRRDGGQQIGIVGQEGHVRVRPAEHERVPIRIEIDRAFEMFFVDRPKRLGSLEFDALRTDPAVRAALGNTGDPRKTHVDEHARLVLLRQQPAEPHRAFPPALHQVDFLRARELFVATQPLDRASQ